MAVQWFVQEHGVESGPFSSAEIKSKAASGDIASETQIRPGNGGWMPASKISGLIFGTKKVDKRKCVSCGQEVKLLDRALDRAFGGSGLCPDCLKAIHRKPVEKSDPAPALAPCPDCSKPCSTRAIACPACGCPIASSKIQDEIQVMSIVGLIFWVIGMVVVIGSAASETTREGVYNIGLIARQQTGVAIGIWLQIAAATLTSTRLFGLVRR
jgi:GYF domain 2